jgi:hypothetical protein
MDVIKLSDVEIVKLLTLTYTSNTVVRSYFVSEAQKEKYLAENERFRNGFHHSHTLAFKINNIYYPLNEGRIIPDD